MPLSLNNNQFFFVFFLLHFLHDHIEFVLLNFKYNLFKYKSHKKKKKKERNPYLK